MPKAVSTAPALNCGTIEVTGYVDTLPRLLREAIREVDGAPYRRAMSELAFTVCEAVERGSYGVGRFSVAMTVSDSEFIVSVKKEA